MSPCGRNVAPPPIRAVRSPAAAGANFCYIACGAGIIMIPILNGAHNSDVSMLLAFNMIFLGLASYSYHYHGDLPGHWSHRADLTFITVYVRATSARPCRSARFILEDAGHRAISC